MYKEKHNYQANSFPNHHRLHANDDQATRQEGGRGGGEHRAGEGGARQGVQGEQVEHVVDDDKNDHEDKE